MTKPIADILIVGGGVNGCGIARDAAGRGLKVILCEKNDLAEGTSSRSTKLFHGGLRYLEYFEFRLVREALRERETLLAAMPHIARPMRFVLPFHPSMRFEGGTPASRLLGRFMPWLRDRRPAFVIRLGLFLYDHMGGRKILPPTRRLNLRKDEAGQALNGAFRKGWEYSDAAVDDARLVVLNARDAQRLGADIRTRSEVVAARRQANFWEVDILGPKGPETLRARLVVNAAGPWVAGISAKLSPRSERGVRLVRGSHIVVPRIFGHDRAYILQGPDGRIVFAIPYHEDFTLIGTTDIDHKGSPDQVDCSDEEVRYLCDFVSRCFKKPVLPSDVVWRYAGLRPLLDDGAGDARSATRDYSLELEQNDRAPLLTVLGGKITTYRKLSEAAVDLIAPLFTSCKAAWTARAPLPGGDFDPRQRDALAEALTRRHSQLTPATARRLIRAYGTEAGAIMEMGPGTDLGGGLHEAELRWMVEREFATTLDDVIWRRSKLGLRVAPEERREIQACLEQLILEQTRGHRQ
ncbi:glycerol-3-phosphate dehydrogenase [Rhodobacter sp. 24-YEA-8]|uniref:glycerol-3-phosphate dehydrogenase n=1 Tax=Rhodobacter sp. 24-YEA-8 TaxID=1884310 RepID=UPI000898280E|nr:glycerol-3-phosphate dehydrogenase [Rhodobacter sp. 24-YEA-8]SED31658.1 homodimeric glycerol 3-phosphate dehydrogenase (quinone) [Rhodobacter sp. 24-YEA-8]